ncbi:hypothetical protein GCM10027275_00210 [Rhabdobacter roseus]|uniref:Outer membrane protein beta-barrel domain-containing protein n=1 Tax=Rhabdobacter roseus TaxID=1655419 RepID=A0A840TL18_9BACT|nr:hypothetical protein [Rhabdobacter roseus]MBB5281903.1 hypothetical protein [Rhabdobacter roseus]
MKRFFLLTLTFIGLASALVRAQTDEYYKKDTLRTDPNRRTTAPLPEPDSRPVHPEGTMPMSERLRLGGSFGLGFGTVTNVNLSPMAGLQITERLVGGVGVTYMWFRSRLFNYNSHYYGGRTFLMYSILPMINLQAEYEALNVEFVNPIESRYERTWLGSPMLGASYSQPLGGKYTRGVHMTLLYNLNYNNQRNPYDIRDNISPYSSPFVFRVTFL